jgi:gluconokinase
MTLRPNIRIVIMGVAGCGKSSVGEALAQRLGIPYRDGDDLHTPQAVEKMRTGIPLTDDDRWPWLDRVAATLAAEAPIILGCSALKRAYRDRVRRGASGPVTLVHLAGSRELIASRMAARTGHYMPTSLLDSQFAALEPPGPDEAITVDIDQPLTSLVNTILTQLEARQ